MQTALAASPDDRHVAYTHGGRLVLLDHHLEQVAAAEASGTIEFLGFAGPSLLALAVGGELITYEVPSLTVAARAPLPPRTTPQAVVDARLVCTAPESPTVTVARCLARTIDVSTFDAPAVPLHVLALEHNQALIVTPHRNDVIELSSRRVVARLNLPLPAPPRQAGTAGMLRYLWTFRARRDDLTVVRLSDGRAFGASLGGGIRQVVASATGVWIVITTDAGSRRLHVQTMVWHPIDADIEHGACVTGGTDPSLYWIDPDWRLRRMSLAGDAVLPSPGGPVRISVDAMAGGQPAPAATAATAAAPAAAAGATTDVADGAAADRPDAAPAASAPTATPSTAHRPAPAAPAATPAATATATATVAAAASSAAALAATATAAHAAAPPSATPVARVGKPVVTSSGRVAVPWRQAIADWARAVLAGHDPVSPPFERTPCGELARRAALSADGARALALLYGAWLAGAPDQPLIAVARTVEWDEVAGRGSLPHAALTRVDDGRVRIRTAVAHFLDGSAPVHMLQLGARARPDVAPGRQVLRAPPDIPAGACARALAERMGAAALVDELHARDRHELQAALDESWLRGLPAIAVAGPDLDATTLAAAPLRADHALVIAWPESTLPAVLEELPELAP